MDTQSYHMRKCLTVWYLRGFWSVVHRTNMLGILPLNHGDPSNFTTAPCLSPRVPKKRLVTDTAMAP